MTAVPEVLPPVKKKQKRYFTKGREFKTVQKYCEAIKAGETKSLTKCAEEAGYSPTYAVDAGKRIQQKINGNPYLQAKMEEFGIGVVSLVQDIRSLRRATLPRRLCKFCKGFGTLEEEKCPHCFGKGYFDDPDNIVRQKNSEFHAKLLDVLPSTKIDVNSRVVNVHITLDTMKKIQEAQEFLDD